MPLLAAFFGSLAASLASFFARWFTTKVAAAAAAITVFTALTVALMAALATGINYFLAFTTVPHWFAVGFNVFMPAHFVAGVSVIVAARVGLALYRWNVTTLSLVASI